MSIQFFDCPNCGKSLRVGARRCHHCHAVDENDWGDPDAAPEFATGGYAEDSEDDEANEFTETKPSASWRRIAMVIIILLLIVSFILPVFLPQFPF